MNTAYVVNGAEMASDCKTDLLLVQEDIWNALRVLVRARARAGMEGNEALVGKLENVSSVLADAWDEVYEAVDNLEVA